MYHKWNKWKPVVIIELCKQNEILLNTDYFVAKNAYMPLSTVIGKLRTIY